MKTAEHIIETVDKLVRKYHTRDPYELCQLFRNKRKSCMWDVFTILDIPICQEDSKASRASQRSR